MSRQISEIALNHKRNGMEGIHDMREEIPERSRALSMCAGFLLNGEKGLPPPSTTSGKVVQLRPVV